MGANVGSTPKGRASGPRQWNNCLRWVKDRRSSTMESRRGIPRAYMIEEEGIVKEVRGKKALVLTDRKAQCSHCTARGFCEMLGGGKEMLSEALNPIGARAEDVVKIGVPAGTVTKASLVVYMIPAVGIVGGAAFGYYMGKLYELHRDLSTLIGSLVGIGISLIFVRLLSNVLSKRPSYQLEIIKIINPHEPQG
jgi:sigma-E factor negative regulatory protein RseC